MKIVVMAEEHYSHFYDILAKQVGAYSKICLVLLHDHVDDAVINLYEHNIKNVVLVHLFPHLSDKYQDHIALSTPNIIELQSALHKAVNNKKCSAVVFSDLSRLLYYHTGHDIQKLTNHLKALKNHDMFYFLQQDHRQIDKEIKVMLRDLEMYADDIIRLS